MAPSFHRLVCRLVRRVPRGRVVTYGQVAALLGHPRAARAVGQVLRALPAAASSAVPWHRVVNSAGSISPRGILWADLQRRRLEAEGIRFDRRGRMDLERLRWEPRRRDARPGRQASRGVL